MDVFALALFEGTRQGTRYRRARQGWRRLTRTLTAIAVLAAAGGEIFLFGRAWTTGVWGNFLFDTVPLLQMLIFPIKGMRLLRSATQERLAHEAAGKLRVAAEQGDERLAPMAAQQPSSAGDDPISDMDEIGPLRNPGASERWSLVGFAALAFTFGAIAGGFALLLLLVPNRDGTRLALASTEGILALVLGVLALVLLGVAAHLAFWTMRLRGRLWLVLDGRGIWLKGSGGRLTTDGVMWGEARAFYRVMLTGLKAESIYVLDDGERMLVWSSGRAEEHEIQAAHLRLCRLIAIHISLPLRDLTWTVAALAKPGPAKQRRKGTHAVTTGANVSTSSEIQGLLAWGSVRWMAGIKAALEMMLIAMLVFYGLAWCAEHVQEWQFQQVVARIAVEHPIFADGLREDDGLWPVGAPDADFVNGAYQISGRYLLPAAAPGVYGSVAVQVTARLVGRASQYDGVGMMLRTGSDDLSGVEFTVNQRGEWSISYWGGDSFGPDSNAAYDQGNGAIHQGDGAANTLVVLMRGNQYICYVNGQFVGSYYHDGDTTGQVALFVDGGPDIVGVFTDFRVLPGV